VLTTFSAEFSTNFVGVSSKIGFKAVAVAMLLRVLSRLLGLKLLAIAELNTKYRTPIREQQSPRNHGDCQENQPPLCHALVFVA
jgi:hypothetical protein